MKALIQHKADNIHHLGVTRQVQLGHDYKCISSPVQATMQDVRIVSKPQVSLLGSNLPTGTGDTGSSLHSELPFNLPKESKCVTNMHRCITNRSMKRRIPAQSNTIMIQQLKPVFRERV